MLARALWLALIYLTLGPGLGGVAFVGYSILADYVIGRGEADLGAIFELAPFFWPFSWAQALLIAVGMLVAWRLLPQRRWRLLASLPVGALGMMLATPLLFGEPLWRFLGNPFALVLGGCAGVATLLCQLITEAAVARAAAED